jgi:hypothetical protein
MLSDRHVLTDILPVDIVIRNIEFRLLSLPHGAAQEVNKARTCLLVWVFLVFLRPAE